jgi:pyridoxine kinase
MPLALVISSYVAASRVGATPAAMALGALKIDPVVIPTTLLGRHPGWGAPGGGPVAVDTMQSMLEAVEAQGLYGMMDGILTGYFATVEQVALAAYAIDAIQEIRPNIPILVDPVIGDARGLYVRPEIAAAIRDQLIPRATLLTPNLFELGWLTGLETAAPSQIAAAAHSLGRNVAVTSFRRGGEIGAAWITGADAIAALAPAHPDAPNGTGDLFAGALLAGMIDQRSRQAALSHAVAVCADIADLAHRWQAPELPIVAAAARLAAPQTIPRQWAFDGDADE